MAEVPRTVPATIAFNRDQWKSVFLTESREEATERYEEWMELMDKQEKEAKGPVDFHLSNNVKSEITKLFRSEVFPKKYAVQWKFLGSILSRLEPNEPIPDVDAELWKDGAKRLLEELTEGNNLRSSKPATISTFAEISGSLGAWAPPKMPMMEEPEEEDEASAAKEGEPQEDAPMGKAAGVDTENDPPPETPLSRGTKRRTGFQREGSQRSSRPKRRASSNQEKNANTGTQLNDLFGDGAKDASFEGSGEVPLSGEKVAIPADMMPSGRAEEGSPEDYDGAVGKGVAGRKILECLCNWGSEFGVMTLFCAALMSSVGALNTSCLVSKKPGSYNPKKAKALTYESLASRAGVKRNKDWTEDQFRQEIFTRYLMVYLLLISLISGSDANSPAKALSTLLEKHGLEMALSDESDGTHVTSLYASAYIYPLIASALAAIGSSTDLLSTYFTSSSPEGYMWKPLFFHRPTKSALLSLPALVAIPMDIKARIEAGCRPWHPSTRMIRTSYHSLKEALEVGYLEPLNVRDAKLLVNILVNLRTEHLTIEEEYTGTGVVRKEPLILKHFRVSQRSLKTLLQKAITPVANLLASGYLSPEASTIAKHTLIRRCQPKIVEISKDAKPFVTAKQLAKMLSETMAEQDADADDSLDL
ncbi:unnamed protein product [Symbiodinium natans]|uniref:Uncharacterized protein n=1 Tax=Symbiodinium natans TaxID=878477 RepID=A0A812LVU6_9DINO|nr:unnamed protein product [Symbiodinium natans]